MGAQESTDETKCRGASGRGLGKAALIAALILCAIPVSLGTNNAMASGAGWYGITDLGAVGPYGSANGINDAGQVVGIWDDGTYSEAFLWSPSTGMRLLGTMGGVDSYGYALNDAASTQIATTVDNGGATIAVVNAEVWQNGTATVLDTTNINRGYAYGINDQGDVVGHIYYRKDTTFCECAGLWHNGVLTNLGTLGGAQHSNAWGINNAGVVAGVTETGLTTNIFHAAEWQNGTLVDLTPNEATYAAAYAINDAGAVVGNMANNSIAAMWQNGTVTTLGSLGGRSGHATAINNANPVQVVGTSDLPAGGQHAWIWQSGQITDLNTLLPPNSGWVATSATGINDAGQIVVNGTFDGVAHAFLLTSQPFAATSPTTLAFGSVNSGNTSGSQTATLTNDGMTALTVSSVTVGGSKPSDFQITGDTCTGASLSPGASCAATVVFEPAETGALSASLYFADNAPGSPQQVGLTGTGVAPAVTLSPSPVSFGSQSVALTSTSQVSVTNSGTGTLTFGAVPFAVSGPNAADFVLGSTTCGSVLTAGASCTVNIAFTPSLSGARTASLYVNDNASGSPQSDPLSGTGLAADLGVSMTASATKVKRGSTLTYTLTTTNHGPGNAVGSRLIDTLPSGTTFSSGSSGCTVSSNQVTCSLGTLAGNATASTSIKILVGSSASSSLINTATINATTADPNSSNNSVSLVTTAFR